MADVNTLRFNFEVLGIQNGLAQVEAFLKVMQGATGATFIEKLEGASSRLTKEMDAGSSEAKELLGLINQIVASLQKAKGLKFSKEQVARAKEIDPRTRITSRKGIVPSVTGKLNIESNIEEIEATLNALKSNIREPIAMHLKGIDLSDRQSVERAASEIKAKIKSIQDPLQKTIAITGALKTLREQLTIRIRETTELKKQKAIISRFRGLSDIVSGGNIKTESLRKQLGGGNVASIDKEAAANKRLADSLQRVNKTQSDINRKTKDSSKNINTFSNSVEVAIGKLIRYRVAFYAMRGAIDAVKFSFKSFIEIQFELAELEKVVDRNTSNMQAFKETAFGLGKTFGGEVVDIVKAMKIWAQTGLAQNEINEATEATLVGMVALSNSMKEVTEALTAAIFTYGVEVEDVTTVLSKWLAVQREFPISAQDLANSLKVVGAAAQVVGVDLDDLAGYVAAIGSATRKSGPAVGQSIKTMFARLPRAEVIRAFEGIGVAVLKNANELRDLDNVLLDLSKKWDGLTSVTKANLAITFGGIRRYSDFIALMDNFQLKLKATEIAQRANTEAQDAAQISLGTFKKQWETTSVALEQFAESVGGELVGGLAKAASSLNDLLVGFNSSESGMAKFIAGAIKFSTIVAGLIIAIVGFKFIMGILGKRVLALRVQFLTLFPSLKAGAATTEAASATMARFATATTTAAVATGFFARAMIILKSVIFPAIGILSVVASIVIGLKYALEDTSIEVFKTSKSLTSFKNSLSANITTIDKSIKALKTQNDLLDILPNKFDKAAKSIKKGGNEGVKSLEKMVSLLDALPATEEFVALSGQVEISQQADNLAIIREITKEVERQKELNEDKIVLLKEEKKFNEEKLKTQKGEELKQIEKNLKGLREFKKEIVNTVGVFSAKGIPLGDIFDIGNSLDKAEKNLLIGINSIFDKVESRIIDSNKTITKVQATSQKIVAEQVESFIRQFAGSQEKLVADTFNKVQSFIATHPFLKDILKFDTKESEQLIEDIRKITDLAIKERDKVISEGGTQEEGFIKFTKVINSNLEDRIQLLKNTIDLESTINDLLELNTKDARETALEISKIGFEAGDLDAQLFIGVKTPKAILSLIENFEKLKRTVVTITTRFATESKKLKFGEFIDEDEFKALEARRFIGNFEKNLLSLSETLFKTKKQLLDITKIDIALNDAGLAKNEKNFSKVHETINEVLSSLKDVSAASKNIVSGENNPFDVLGTKAKELEQSLKELEETQKRYFDDPDLDKSINTWNKYSIALKETEYVQSRIKDAFVPNIAGLDTAIRLLSSFEGREADVAKLQRQKLDLQLKFNLELAKAEVDSKRYTKEVGVQKKHHKDIVKLLEQQRDKRLDKILEKAAANAKVLKDSLSAAFGNIPENMLEHSEARNDLAREEREIQFELQLSRREGDREAIIQAEHRLSVVQQEISTHKRGWAELRDLIGSIFGNIGSAFFKNLVDQVSTSLSNITIGGQTLGEQIGDAIGVASTQFADDWASEAQRVLDDFARKIIEASNLDRQRRGLTDLNTFVLPTKRTSVRDLPLTFADASFDLTNSILRNSNKDSKKQSKGNIDKLTELQKTLKSSLTLLSVTFATAFKGTKNRSANLGAQFGAGVGAAGFEKLFTSSIGLVAGPLGALAGGLLGGALGGLFGGDDVPEKPLVNALNNNENAVINNTLAIKQLDKQLFNLPTNFNVPAFSGGGFSKTPITVIVTLDGEEISSRAITMINDKFDSDSINSGNRGFEPI